MSTKDIRTSHTHSICDVCGRTLLRGEHADVYINGGARRSVCELCTTRALHEGWVREGTLQGYAGADAGPARRRSLFARLRRQRAPTRRGQRPTSMDAELADDAWGGYLAATEPEPEVPAPPQRPAGETGRGREPRHVRAVPTSDDHKTASAVDVFNAGEYCRTIAGVARSLGSPAVSVVPDGAHPTLVRIVVAWELCWYRYVVDLADEVGVRLDGQGYELDELGDGERTANAVADDAGRLSLS